MPEQGGSRQNVTFPSNGRTAHGYLARPPQGVGPGLVVVQEWWGLTSHVAATADRFAASDFAGYARLGHRSKAGDDATGVVPCPAADVTPA